MTITVEAVDRRGIDEFIAVARDSYRDDPHWVALPDDYQRRRLDRAVDPFWRHAEGELFVARRNGAAAGRILAFRDHAYESAHGDDGLGFFGWFESPDDPVIAGALFAAAEKWLQTRGRRSMRGPFAFTPREEMGVVVNGFVRRPRVRTPYNPFFYPSLYEACGLTRVREYVAWELQAWNLSVPPPALADRSQRSGASSHVQIHPLPPTGLTEAIDDIVEVHNDALRESFNFVPMTREEAAALLDQVVTFGDANLCWTARVDGQPAGFVIALPDLNEALWRPSNFRLFALAKALYLRRGVRAVRVVLIAVREKFRGLNLAAHLIYHTWQSAMDAGLIEAEFSPVDAADVVLNRMLSRIGCRATRRLALYQRPLT